ncbi:MAG: isopentenyl-diphosphate Delta-isomerase [Bacteroidetes bacterium]|nr:isopentenyl-diphosphate Delta-isomerase [Bacteroidota bacterium]
MINTTEFVVLVDEHDRQTGLMEKLDAHRKGLLHRAISVFVFNSRGELLIHRRALEKYHSGGLWTNTCCSHPRDGETAGEAAVRRLREEMGMVCELTHQFQFIYRADLDHELTEHELDHVFTGISDTNPQPDPAEVMDWRWVRRDDLLAEMSAEPEKFTAWFKIIAERAFAITA